MGTEQKGRSPLLPQKEDAGVEEWETSGWNPKAIQCAPEERAARLKALKAAVEAGTYQVPADRLADSLVRHLLRSKKRD